MTGCTPLLVRNLSLLYVHFIDFILQIKAQNIHIIT